MRTTKLTIYPETQVIPTNLDLALANTTGWNLNPSATTIVYDNYSLLFTNTVNYAQVALSTSVYIANTIYRVEYKIEGASANTKHNVYLNGNVSKTSTGNGFFSVQVKVSNNIAYRSKFAIVLKENILKGTRISQMKSWIVEEKEIELYTDETIPLNFALQDLTDISKRATNYSKTIKIPGSPSNNIVFKHVYQVATKDSFRMNVGVNARYTNNDVELFSGYLFLKGISVSNNDNSFEYECDLRSEINTLFKLTSDKLLRGNIDPQYDLDFSEYNHIKNYANVSTSWWKGSVIDNVNYSNLPTAPTYNINKNTTELGTGYVYPLINYGQITEAVQMTEMRPAIFMYEVFKKILDNAGYTFTSTFINSERFKRLVYPRTTKVEDAEFDSSILTFTNNVNTERDINNNTVGNNYFMVNHNPNNTNANKEFTVNSMRLPINFGNIDYFIPNSAGTYKIDASFEKTIFSFALGSNSTAINGEVISLRNWTNGQMGWVEIKCIIDHHNGLFTQVGETLKISCPDLDNHQQYWYKYPHWSSSSISNNSYINDLVSFESDNIPLNLTDTISFTANLCSPHKDGTIPSDIFNQATPGNWNYMKDIPLLPDTKENVYIKYTIPANAIKVNISKVSTNTINEGMLVQPTYNLHSNIKQSDFLMSIIKMFNLMVDIDPLDDHNLIIEPYEDYYKFGITRDWSQKRDMSKELQIEEASDLNRKNLTFTYTEDEDFYNKGYTASTITHIYGDLQILSDISTNETTLVKPFFAATPLDKFVTNQNQNSIVTSQILQNNGYNADTRLIDFDTKTAFKPRILYWGGLQYFRGVGNSSAGWELITASTNYMFSNRRVGSKWYPYAGHVDKPLNNTSTFDLDFGHNFWYWSDSINPITSNNLVSEYYSNMLNEFSDKDSKKITGYFDLNNDDIRTLMFYDKIIIKEQGIDSYYRVNKIIDYVPGKLTKVELFKLIDQTVNVKYTPVQPPIITRPVIDDIENNNKVLSTMSAEAIRQLQTSPDNFATYVKASQIALTKPVQYYTKLIRGGTDTTNEMFSHSIIEKISGGIDCVKGYGSSTEINKIDGNIYYNKTTNLIEEVPDTTVNSSTGVSGYSGYSGYSGQDGTIGVNGTSGYSGYSGYSGVSLSIVPTTSVLPTSGWSGNAQAIGVSGVTTSNTIMWSASTLADSILAGQANLFCTTQATDSLTFVCSTTPASDISIKIIIV